MMANALRAVQFANHQDPGGAAARGARHGGLGPAAFERSATPVDRADIEQAIAGRAQILRDYGLMSGRRLTEAQATSDAWGEDPQLYALWDALPPSAEPVSVGQPVIKSALPAHVPIAREMDARIDLVMRPLRGILPQREFDARRAIEYDKFLKSAEGRRLYSLHEAVQGHTLAEVEKSKPDLAAEIRKYVDHL